MSHQEKIAKDIWIELKNKCCADPEKAKRIVMVNESDVIDVVKLVLKNWNIEEK